MKRIALIVCGMLAASAASGAEIGAIQGGAHRSPLAGQRADAEGVVTLVRGNGFFLQGTADGDLATSDGIFVFSSATPPVGVGDRVRVEGRVVEFTPPNQPQQLPLTEIAEPEIIVLESGAALPDAVLLGPGGRMPPTEVVDDDGLTTFDPETDAIDFYESLEGMRVLVEDAIALDRVNDFGEVWALAAGDRAQPASTAATPSSCARRTRTRSASCSTWNSLPSHPASRRARPSARSPESSTMPSATTASRSRSLGSIALRPIATG